MTYDRSARMAQAAEFKDIAQAFRDLSEEWEDAGVYAGYDRCRRNAAKYDARANDILFEIAADETLAAIAPPQKPRRSWLAAAVDLVRQRLGLLSR